MFMFRRDVFIGRVLQTTGRKVAVLSVLELRQEPCSAKHANSPCNLPSVGTLRRLRLRSSDFLGHAKVEWVNLGEPTRIGDGMAIELSLGLATLGGQAVSRYKLLKNGYFGHQSSPLGRIWLISREPDGRRDAAWRKASRRHPMPRRSI